MTFETALKFVLKAEGGYSDDKADRGGATMNGVTQATFDAWNARNKRVNRPVSSISNDEIKQIYSDNYWIPSACPKLSDRLATAHFDSAVNHGVYRACKLLQRAVGMNEDGKVGPKTLAAIAALPEDEVIKDYIAARFDFYHDIVTNDPLQARFLNGWIARLDRLEQEVA